MAQLQNDSAENEISSRDQFDVKVISSREYETDTDCIYKHNSLDLMVFATLELHEKIRLIKDNLILVLVSCAFNLTRN